MNERARESNGMKMPIVIVAQNLMRSAVGLASFVGALLALLFFPVTFCVSLVALPFRIGALSADCIGSISEDDC